MASFHEELVEARRRGETLVPVTASDAEAEREIEVNFYPAPFDGLSTCGRCLTLLVTEYAPSHKAWHQEMGG